MALYVNTNVSSLNAQSRLTRSTDNLNDHYRKLGSGLRLNTAADDAANLHISDRLTGQIKGLDQGNRNSADGIALAQTMDGALDETLQMLQKIRVLAVQSANGTYTEDDRKVMQEEVSQICDEINRIARKTTYAGARILDGAESADPAAKGVGENLLGQDGTVSFQVGADSYDLISVDMKIGFTLLGINKAAGLVTGKEATPDTINGDKNAAFTGLVMQDNGDVRWSVSRASNAQATLANIDQFIQIVDSHRAQLGSVASRMESNIRNKGNTSENESDSRSRIRDTDFASETAGLTQNSILQNASQTVLTQANQRPSIALSLLR